MARIALCSISCYDAKEMRDSGLVNISKVINKYLYVKSGFNCFILIILEVPLKQGSSIQNIYWRRRLSSLSLRGVILHNNKAFYPNIRLKFV